MTLKQRKKNRLSEYDYSQNGAYFVTICVQNRKPILSKILPDQMYPMLLPVGNIAQQWILALENRFVNVTVDQYIIMPDHIHLFLMIDKGTGDPSPTAGIMMAWLKYNITKQVNQTLNTPGCRLFQRSYFDHVIRNKADYDATREYIDNNPTKWKIVHGLLSP